MVRLLVTITLFFISQYCLAAEDSLFLVKKSRILFCLQENARAAVLTEKILVQDSIIKLNTERIELKDSIIYSLYRDIAVYEKQDSLSQTTITLLSTERLKYYNAFTSESKKNNNLIKAVIGLSALDLLFLLLLLL